MERYHIYKLGIAIVFYAIYCSRTTVVNGLKLDDVTKTSNTTDSRERRDAGDDLFFYQGADGTPGVDFPTLSYVPRTKFTCKNMEGGYYADIETDCQAFHICDEGRKLSFLCPNGTIFQQSELICDWWYKVNCTNAPSLYEESAEVLQKETARRKDARKYQGTKQAVFSGKNDSGYQRTPVQFVTPSYPYKTQVKPIDNGISESPKRKDYNFRGDRKLDSLGNGVREGTARGGGQNGFESPGGRNKNYESGGGFRGGSENSFGSGRTSGPGRQFGTTATAENQGRFHTHSSSQTRDRGQSAFGREPEKASFGRDQDQTSFGRDQVRGLFGGTQGPTSFPKEQGKASFGKEQERGSLGGEQRAAFGRTQSPTAFGTGPGRSSFEVLSKSESSIGVQPFRGRDQGRLGARGQEQPGGRKPEQLGGRDQEKPGGRDQEKPGGKDQEQPGGRNPGKFGGSAQGQFTGRAQGELTGRAQGEFSGQAQEDFAGRTQGGFSVRAQDDLSGRPHQQLDKRPQDQFGQKTRGQFAGKTEVQFGRAQEHFVDGTRGQSADGQTTSLEGDAQEDSFGGSHGQTSRGQSHNQSFGGRSQNQPLDRQNQDGQRSTQASFSGRTQGQFSFSTQDSRSAFDRQEPTPSRSPAGNQASFEGAGNGKEQSKAFGDQAHTQAFGQGQSFAQSTQTPSSFGRTTKSPSIDFFQSQVPSNQPAFGGTPTDQPSFKAQAQGQPSPRDQQQPPFISQDENQAPFQSQTGDYPKPNLLGKSEKSSYGKPTTRDQAVFGTTIQETGSTSSSLESRFSYKPTSPRTYDRGQTKFDSTAEGKTFGTTESPENGRNPFGPTPSSGRSTESRTYLPRKTDESTSQRSSFGEQHIRFSTSFKDLTTTERYFGGTLGPDQNRFDLDDQKSKNVDQSTPKYGLKPFESDNDGKIPVSVVSAETQETQEPQETASFVSNRKNNLYGGGFKQTTNPYPNHRETYSEIKDPRHYHEQPQSKLPEKPFYGSSIDPEILTTVPVTSRGSFKSTTELNSAGLDSSTRSYENRFSFASKIKEPISKISFGVDSKVTSTPDVGVSHLGFAGVRPTEPSRANSPIIKLNIIPTTARTDYDTTGRLGKSFEADAHKTQVIRIQHFKPSTEKGFRRNDVEASTPSSSSDVVQTFGRRTDVRSTVPTPSEAEVSRLNGQTYTTLAVPTITVNINEVNYTTPAPTYFASRKSDVTEGSPTFSSILQPKPFSPPTSNYVTPASVDSVSGNGLPSYKVSSASPFAATTLRGGPAPTAPTTYTTVPSYLETGSPIDENVDNMVNTLMEMVKKRLGGGGSNTLIELEEKLNTPRPGLVVPPSAGPQTLHTLAIYFANALDNLTMSNPRELQESVDEEGETDSPIIHIKNEELIKSLLTQMTRENYNELFKAAKEAGVTEPTLVSRAEASDENDLLRQDTKHPAEGPPVRQLARVFTEALSAYLDDPDTFRKVLQEVRPTEPPLFTTEEASTDEDEVLNYSDSDLKSDHPHLPTRQTPIPVSPTWGYILAFKNKTGQSGQPTSLPGQSGETTSSGFLGETTPSSLPEHATRSSFPDQPTRFSFTEQSTRASASGGSTPAGLPLASPTWGYILAFNKSETADNLESRNSLNPENENLQSADSQSFVSQFNKVTQEYKAATREPKTATKAYKESENVGTTIASLAETDQGNTLPQNHWTSSSDVAKLLQTTLAINPALLNQDIHETKTFTTSDLDGGVSSEEGLSTLPPVVSEIQYELRALPKIELNSTQVHGILIDFMNGTKSDGSTKLHRILGKLNITQDEFLDKMKEIEGNPLTRRLILLLISECNTEKNRELETRATSSDGVFNLAQSKLNEDTTKSSLRNSDANTFKKIVHPSLEDDSEDTRALELLNSLYVIASKFGK